MQKILIICCIVCSKFASQYQKTSKTKNFLVFEVFWYSEANLEQSMQYMIKSFCMHLENTFKNSDLKNFGKIMIFALCRAKTSKNRNLNGFSYRHEVFWKLQKNLQLFFIFFQEFKGFCKKSIFGDFKAKNKKPAFFPAFLPTQRR